MGSMAIEKNDLAEVKKAKAKMAKKLGYKLPLGKVTGLLAKEYNDKN